MSPINVQRLALATFESSNPARLVGYYSDVIGLSEVGNDGTTAYLASPAGETCLAVRRAASSGCTELSFQCRPEGSLAEVGTWLAARGISAGPRSDPHPGIAESLVFDDVNGTTIEIFTQAPAPTAAVEQLGIGPLKLGHVAFRTRDIEATVKFYREVLGFRVSDWMGDFFVFLRCGPDHHTVNFIQGPTPKFHHLAFELRDWFHVQLACDLLSRHGLRLTWGPGRHGIGHNIFTYHRNSDDQIVELFAELDTMSNEELGYFDPRPWHRDRPQRPKMWEPEGDASNLWGAPAPPGHRDL